MLLRRFGDNVVQIDVRYWQFISSCAVFARNTVTGVRIAVDLRHLEVVATESFSWRLEQRRNTPAAQEPGAWLSAILASSALLHGLGGFSPLAQCRHTDVRPTVPTTHRPHNPPSPRGILPIAAMGGGGPKGPDLAVLYRSR